MKRSLLCALLLPSLALAQPAGFALSHMGRLTLSNDAPVEDAELSFSFSLFDVETDGEAVWSATYEKVPVRGGLYEVVLGGDPESPLPVAVFQAPGTRWLEVRLGEVVFEPRQPLTPIPWAVRAEQAWTADGAKEAEEAVRATRAQDALLLEGLSPEHLLMAETLTGTLSSERLPPATLDEAGALSASDKAKLDALVVGEQLVALLAGGPLFLSREDGETRILLSLAGAETDGAMSASDKAKLDGITAGATLTGLAVNAPLQKSGPETNPTLSLSSASAAADGALSASDKAKLDGLTAGATLTGLEVSAPLVKSGLETNPTLSLPLASAAADGALSASDKAKLDGIESGAKLTGLGVSAPLVKSGPETNPTLSLSSASVDSDGALSASDKSKLDGLTAGAKLTGLGVSAPLVKSGSETNPTLSLSLVTTGSAGAMSASDKAKLDGIAAGAKLAGLSVSAPLEKEGTDSAPTLSLSLATQDAAGALSAGDKAKLDRMQANVRVGAARPTGPEAGTIFLNSATKLIELFDGGQWRPLVQNHPANCLEIKTANPQAASGRYTIAPRGGSLTVEVYCEMTMKGGGWTLISNRRGGAAFNNTEACGPYLGAFFEGGCGSADKIGYGDSYALPGHFRKALVHTEVLLAQYASNGTMDADDAYIMTTPLDLFPNYISGHVWDTAVSKVCAYSNDNDCVSANVRFRYTRTGHYSNSLCNGGYKGEHGGNYGLCVVNTATNSSIRFGNRSGYAETKLWGYGSGTAQNWQERIFYR